jgi:hypothetical protein
MLPSLLLAAFVFALALLCAWAVVHFGRKAGQSPGKLRALAIAFVLGGVLCSAFAYWVDAGQRRVTLFEALLPGTEASAVPVTRGASFEVEHAGVEHQLTLLPKPGFGQNAGRPVSATVLLRLDDGERLVAERVSFATRRETSTGGHMRTLWEDRTWRFVPPRAGTATLEVVLETAGVHELFVRVEDPEKHDGERAPGY